jgi:hypothetical protein
MVFICDGK